MYQHLIQNAEVLPQTLIFLKDLKKFHQIPADER